MRQFYRHVICVGMCVVLGAQLLVPTQVTAAPYVVTDEVAWQKAIAAKLVKNFRYPRSAIRKGIEGKALVEVKIDATGAITGFDVLTPTGQGSLDREIPKLMKRLNPLPAPPGGAPTSVKLPLSWRLQ